MARAESPAQADPSPTIAHPHELPPLEPGGGPWRRIIDTTYEAPDDFVDALHAAPLAVPTYRAGPRSVVVLVAGRNGSRRHREATG